MSTEAPAPKTPGTPDQKGAHIDRTAHPEGVRAFKRGDLKDVANQLEVPTNASAINPDTHEVTFDKVPLTKPERKRRKGLWVGFGVGAAAVAAVVAAFVSSGGDNDKPEPTKTSQSSDPSQSPETGAPSAETGTELIGEPSVAFDTLNTNVTPAAELPAEQGLESLEADFAATVQEAYNPVVTDSPQEALTTLWNGYNVRMLSGQVDVSNGHETAASVANRDRLDEVLFAKGEHTGTAAQVENENALRELLAFDIDNIYVLGLVKDSDPTYREDLEIVGDPTENADGSLTFEVVIHVNTNLGNEGFDTPLQDNFDDLNVTEKPGTITIVQAKDGSWGFSNLSVG